MTEQEYDLIVLGAGAVGENVADYATRGGMRTVVVESALVGGECSYWACMPSKALLRPAAVLRAARAVDGARRAVTGGVDAVGAFARRDAIVHHHDDASQTRWLASAGIDLVRGHGVLVGERRVRVEVSDGDPVDLVARHAVAVCTGSEPRIPDTPGLAEANPWTSRDATSATEVPASLAVIGGGVVACELALAYAGLGARVTMLVRGDSVLGGMEPFAAEAVRAGLEEAGVELRTRVEVEEASAESGSTALRFTGGDLLSVERVLVATGRAPRTRDLGLETVGLEPGDWIEVDDTLRVPGSEWLYAVGDVTRRALFTHQGKYQARAAGDVMAARAAGRPVEDGPWGRHVATADHTAVPQVVFTDPEVAAVGLTAEAARAAGRRIRTVDYDLSWLAGATTHADDYRGHARAVIDEERKVLVGATFVGADVAELVQAATIAIVGEVPLARLWHAVPAYPTLSEVWLRFLEEYGRDESA
ncbi:MAG: NAD(P)/FAD-dependent oxidoreductase [Microbacteriaceae bacterium]|nr:NAD(P)/FAD-dependent oxidoreductase [Microbacteriaceae bacterium]